MGCHTWFYRKIERTQEQAKESCLKQLKYQRNLSWKIYKNPNYRGFDWELDKKSQLEMIKVLNRKIRMVSNNYCQMAVWNNQGDEDLTVYIQGKGLFIEDTGFHDEFRKYGYPENKLFSYKETIDYIETPDNECSVYENTLERLKEFWDLYPDGMIEFG